MSDASEERWFTERCSRSLEFAPSDASTAAGNFLKKVPPLPSTPTSKHATSPDASSPGPKHQQQPPQDNKRSFQQATLSIVDEALASLTWKREVGFSHEEPPPIDGAAKATATCDTAQLDDPPAKDHPASQAESEAKLKQLAHEKDDAHRKYLAPCDQLSDSSKWPTYTNVKCDMCGLIKEKCTERPLEQGRYCDLCADRHGIFQVFFDEKQGCYEFEHPICFLCNANCGTGRSLRQHVTRKKHLKVLETKHSIESPLLKDAHSVVGAAVEACRRLRLHIPNDRIEKLPIATLGEPFAAFEDLIRRKAGIHNPQEAHRNKATTKVLKATNAQEEATLSYVKHVDPSMSDEDFTLLLRELSTYKIFSLDTETAPPRFYPQINRFFPGPHLIQIASEDHVWLFTTLTDRMIQTALKLSQQQDEVEKADNSAAGQAAHQGSDDPDKVEGPLTATQRRQVISERKQQDHVEGEVGQLPPPPFGFHEEELDLGGEGELGCGSSGTWHIESVSPAQGSGDVSDMGIVRQLEKYQTQQNNARRVLEADVHAMNARRLPSFLCDFFRRTDAVVIGFGLQNDKELLQRMIQVTQHRHVAPQRGDDIPSNAAALDKRVPRTTDQPLAGCHSVEGEYLPHNGHFIPMLDIATMLPTEEVDRTNTTKPSLSSTSHDATAADPMLLEKDAAVAMMSGIEGDTPFHADAVNKYLEKKAGGQNNTKPILHPGRSVGAVQATARVLQQQFVKNKRISVSNWAVPSRKLRPVQLLYAARDAVLPLVVYKKLLDIAREETVSRREDERRAKKRLDAMLRNPVRSVALHNRLDSNEPVEQPQCSPPPSASPREEADNVPTAIPTSPCSQQQEQPTLLLEA